MYSRKNSDIHMYNSDKDLVGMVNSIEINIMFILSNILNNTIYREIWKIDFKHKVNTFDLQ